MEFKISTTSSLLRIKNPQSIRTPRLVVFENAVDYNLQKMRKLLKFISPGANLGVLCPHVKTAKSIWAVRKMMSAGIAFFKCTLNEVELLFAAGAKEIFVSYPLLPADAEWLAQKIDENPQITFYIQLGHPKHIEFVLDASKNVRIQWNYFIDLNVGMGRTGLEAEEAFAFYKKIAHHPVLRFVGLHAYDGHIHHTSAMERDVEAGGAMERLIDASEQFFNHGVEIEKNIVAGTPSFLHDLKYLLQQKYPVATFYSPGTWIYFDTNYQEMMPETFEPAAFVLAQVMDMPSRGLVTLNLGYKRWAVDQGPIEAFSMPGMEAVSWSEEHTVVSVPENTKINIGDYLLIAPRHVCSTVNMWEYSVVVDGYGDISEAECPIEGRNR